jgi:hypothetical protein
LLSVAVLEAGAWGLGQLKSTLACLSTDTLLHLLLKAYVATESIEMKLRSTATATAFDVSSFLPPVDLVKEDDLPQQQQQQQQQQQHYPHLSFVMHSMVAQCEISSNCWLDTAMRSLTKPLSAELRCRFSFPLLSSYSTVLAPLLHELSRSTATPDRRATARLLRQLARAPQSSNDDNDGGGSGDNELADGGWGGKRLLDDIRVLGGGGALKSVSVSVSSTLSLKECVAV